MTRLLLKKKKKKGYDRNLIEIVREAQLKNDLSFIFIQKKIDFPKKKKKKKKDKIGFGLTMIALISLVELKSLRNDQEYILYLPRKQYEIRLYLVFEQYYIKGFYKKFNDCV